MKASRKYFAGLIVQKNGVGDERLPSAYTCFSGAHAFREVNGQIPVWLTVQYVPSGPWSGHVGPVKASKHQKYQKQRDHQKRVCK